MNEYFISLVFAKGEEKKLKTFPRTSSFFSADEFQIKLMSSRFYTPNQTENRLKGT